MNGYFGRLLFVLILQSLLWSGSAKLDGVRHDQYWVPEYVLVATAQNVTINCHSRYSVVFNTTSPGPTLYLTEGKTTWVRVYNHIEDKNVTVVSDLLLVKLAIADDRLIS